MSTMLDLLNRLAAAWIARDRGPGSSFVPSAVHIRPDGLNVAGSFQHPDAAGPGGVQIDLEQPVAGRFLLRVVPTEVPPTLGPDLEPFQDVLERLAVTATVDFGAQPTLAMAHVVAFPSSEDTGFRNPQPPLDHPVLDFLSALATRQAAARSSPSGRARVTGLDVESSGLRVHLQVKDPLGKPAVGAIQAHVESVGSDHAYLALKAEGGWGFRTVAGALLKAGTLVEPLVRSLLGRGLMPGVEARGSHVKLMYGPFLDGLADVGDVEDETVR